MTNTRVNEKLLMPLILYSPNDYETWTCPSGYYLDYDLGPYKYREANRIEK